MSLRTSVHPGVSCRDDFPLKCRHSALLVVDVQNYLTHPEHAYFNQDAFPRAVRNIDRLAAHFRRTRDSSDSGCEVIFTFLQAATKDRRDISLDYKLSGSLLANIPRLGDTDIFCEDCHPDTSNGKGDILVPKTSCSAFQSTNLHYLLANLGIQQLVIVGQLTDKCIQSTVRDAADLGYFVTLVQDSCAAYSLKDHENGLNGMTGYCRFVSTDAVVREINEDVATTPDPNDVSLVNVSNYLKENGFIDAAFAVVGRFSHSRTESPDVRINGNSALSTSSQPGSGGMDASTDASIGVPVPSSLQNDDDIVTVTGTVTSEMDGYQSKLQIETFTAISKALPKFKPGRDPSVVSASAVPAIEPFTPSVRQLEETKLPSTSGTNSFEFGVSQSELNIKASMNNIDAEKNVIDPELRIVQPDDIIVHKDDPADTHDTSFHPSQPSSEPSVESSTENTSQHVNGASMTKVATNVLPVVDERSEPDLLSPLPTGMSGRDPVTTNSPTSCKVDSSEAQSPRDVSNRYHTKDTGDRFAVSPSAIPVGGDESSKPRALPRYKKGRDPSVLIAAVLETSDRPELSRSRLGQQVHEIQDPMMKGTSDLARDRDSSNANFDDLMRRHKSERDMGVVTATIDGSASGSTFTDRPVAPSSGTTTMHASPQASASGLPRYKPSRDPSVFSDEKSMGTLKMDNRSRSGVSGVTSTEGRYAPASSSLSKAQYVNMREASATLRDGVASFPESVLKAVAIEMVPNESSTASLSNAVTSPHRNTPKSDSDSQLRQAAQKRSSDPPARKETSYSFVEL